MEKYGETPEDIENKCTGVEWYEYLFSGGDDMLNQVVNERAIRRLNSSSP